MSFFLPIASALLAGTSPTSVLVSVAPTLNAAGAALAVTEAERRARASGAPSAIAVVDRSGMLLAFERMDGARAGSVDLAIGKAHAAALMERPTAELEANVANGRFALATSGLTALRGGAPLIVSGICVGAIGVAGLNKDQDAAIASLVAAGLDEAIERAPAAATHKP